MASSIITTREATEIGDLPGVRIQDLPSGESEWRRSFSISRWLLLRALGGIYAIAFASFWVQASGLVGEGGILPAGALLDSVQERLGLAALWRLPSVFWLASGDAALHAACALGVAAAVVLALGRVQRLCCVLLWALYLSITSIGQIFLGYQWDALLLETGLLAIALAPAGRRARLRDAPPPHPVVLFLLRWLLFRLMFLSGAVKLASGDAAWRDLTALTYHYWTQPLPSWSSPLAHALPEAVHRAATGAALAIELVLPFAVFGPRPLRLVAALGFLALQLSINATGNYGFFGLLSLALCLPLVDDGVWRRVPALRRRAPPGPAAPRRRSRASWAAAAVAALAVVGITSALGWRRVARAPLPPAIEAAVDVVRPLHSLNAYGLFATMTKDRPEIELAGSRDGRHWEVYEFRYKPDRLDEAPPLVPGHMPRLDWQMWFAALGSCRGSPWLLALQHALLRGAPAVSALLERDPFPDAPPRYLRADLYRYRFAERGSDWWTRERLGPYCPILALDGPEGEGLRVARPE